MKRRYSGIVSMAISIAALAAMIGYGVYLAEKMKGKGKIKFPRLPEEVVVPDKTVMAKVDALYPKLYELTVLKDDPTDACLKAFGYTPTEMERRAANRRAGSHQARIQESFAYDLTLAFASKGKRFCIIDGNLYANHQTLPDKAKIIAIEHDRVLVRKNNMAKWIYLNKESLIPEGNAETKAENGHKTKKEEV